jgi:hypothetical protein
VLVDGQLAAVWREPLVIEPLRALSARERKAVDAEGERMAAFWSGRRATR